MYSRVYGVQTLRNFCLPGKRQEQQKSANKMCDAGTSGGGCTHVLHWAKTVQWML